MNTGKRGLVLSVLSLVSLITVNGAEARADLFAGSGSPLGVGRVIRFDEQTGAFVSTFVGPSSGGINGVAFGPNGNFFVGNGGLGEVVQYNGSTGTIIGPFAPANGVYGVGFGPNGDLYVTTSGSGIQRFNGSTGAFIDSFIPSAADGAFTFGRDGNLYLTQTSIGVQKFDGRTGAFLGTFVPLGSGGLNNPQSVEFGPDGNLYVPTYDSGQVLRFNGTTGAFMDVFVKAGSGGIGHPTDAIFGPDGDLFVLSRANASVLRYDGTTGAFLGTFASDPSLSSGVFLTFTPRAPVVTSVPEPCTLALFGIGSLALFGWVRRRRPGSGPRSNGLPR